MVKVVEDGMKGYVKMQENELDQWFSNICLLLGCPHKNHLLVKKNSVLGPIPDLLNENLLGVACTMTFKVPW